MKLLDRLPFVSREKYDIKQALLSELISKHNSLKECNAINWGDVKLLKDKVDNLNKILLQNQIELSKYKTFALPLCLLIGVLLGMWAS